MWSDGREGPLATSSLDMGRYRRYEVVRFASRSMSWWPDRIRLGCPYPHDLDRVKA